MTIQTKLILMSAPMVLATLREIEAPGTGKTQTRRIIKPQPIVPADLDGSVNEAWQAGFIGVKCPYGKPGDLLYVRENWQALSFGDYVPTKNHVSDVRYAATDPLADLDGDARGYPWRPSIHMPRWASRITLEITDIRVERLQSISEADVRAEGLRADRPDPRPTMPAGVGCMSPITWGDGKYYTAISAYRGLWTSINGPESWDKNPWLWAVTFTPHLINVDEFIKERGS